MQEKTARNLFLGGLLVYFSVACAEPQPREPKPLPRSRWEENYTYHWNPPQNWSAAPSGLTVCVVRPNFGNDADNLLHDPIYKKWAKGFAKSMAVDMDKSLVAKSMRVAGPYETYDDITYPDKQSSDLALTPTVFIVPTVRYGDAGPHKRASYGGDGASSPGADGWIGKGFHMEVQGFVAFELREPLSKEKLWVKKLELEPESTSGVECYEAIEQRNNEGYVVGYAQGKLLYDGKQDALADVMEKWYPVIMEKAWTYLNTEEMRAMKPQIEEIRKMKRY